MADLSIVNYGSFVRSQKRAWEVLEQTTDGPPPHICILELNQRMRREMVSLLRDVTDILNQYNFSFAAGFGTLLGLVRNKDLLAHDDDMDFIAITKIQNLSNIPWLKLGFDLRVTIPNKQVSINRKNNHWRLWPFLELFSQHEDMLGRGVPKTRLLDTVEVKYAFSCLPTRPVTVRIPIHAVSILNALHGEDWKIVIRGVQTHLRGAKIERLYARAASAEYNVETGYLITN